MIEGGKMSVHKQTKNIINRLSSIEGHTIAVKRMVEENQPCADILIQISAIRSAMDKVGRIILEDHIESCVLKSLEEGNIEQHLADLKIALDHFIS